MAEVKGDSLAVYVYDEIGSFGITAKGFIEDVASAAGVNKLDIHINSPGGDVFQGLAIYNFLKRHKSEKTVYVDGMAGSIASIIAMAGDKVVMPENAFMFIHNPWTVTAGNADDLRQEAEALMKMQTALMAVYAERTGLPDADLQQMMDDDTWLTASEAVEFGFADEIAGAVKMAAKYNPALYASIPVEIAMKLTGDDEMDESAPVAEQPVAEEVEQVEAVIEPDAEAVVAEEEAKADEVVEQTAAESVEEPPVDEPELVDARAEFKAFVARFGSERAADYFEKGLSLDDANSAYMDDLIKEVATLKAKLEEKADAQAAAFDPASDTRSFWDKYADIKDPKARAKFYQSNKQQI